MAGEEPFKMSFADYSNRPNKGRASPSSSSKLQPHHIVNINSTSKSLDYMQHCRYIAEKIANYQKRIHIVSGLTGGLGSSTETKATRSTLYQEIERGNELAREISDALTSLSEDFIDGVSENITPREINERKFQLHKFAKDLEVRVSVFDRSVKEALYREQLVVDNARRNLPLQGGSVVDFDDDGEVMSLLKEETALESDLAYQEALIAEREGEIQRIQSSVVEVNTIFKDLAVIITHQGEHLESIDANMYASSEKTKEGLNELRKAAKLQMSNRTQVYCLVVLVVILSTTLFSYRGTIFI